MSNIAILQHNPTVIAKATFGNDLNRLILTANKCVPGGAELTLILEKLQECRVLAYAALDKSDPPPPLRIGQ